MNKQIKYVAVGFLMALVLLSLVCGIRFMMAIAASRAAFVSTAQSPSEKAPIVFNEKGKALFQNKCSACHCIRKTDCIPSLEHAEERLGKPLLYEWIRNSSGVLKSGNKYFTTMVEKFGGVRMTDFPELTNEDIDVIMVYIKQEYLVLNNHATPVL